MSAMQVVISPHVYGPSISDTTNDDAGTALWTRLSQSFGYLNLEGYGGHIFPIAIGEFGTTFAQTTDQVLFADFARYLRNVQADGTPVDALHNPITSFFWFAWNANSGDTGGLVTSPNWDSIVWQKIEYLQGLGLAPWYTGAAPSTVVVGGSTTTPTTPAIAVNATPAVTVAAVPATNASAPSNTTAANNTTPVATAISTNTTPAVTTPSASTNASTSPASSLTPTTTPAPNVTAGTSTSLATTPSTTVVSAPTTNPAPATTPTAPGPPATQTACSVTASYGDYWIDPNNGPYMTTVSLTLFSTGTEVIPVPWSITIVSTEYTAVEYTWNWQIASAYDGNSVSGTASYFYQDLQPGGGGANLGYVAGSAQSTTFIPASVSVNGQVCQQA